MMVMGDESGITGYGRGRSELYNAQDSTNITPG